MLCRRTTIFSLGFFIGISSISQAQSWGQLGLDIDGEAQDDRSGTSVSMSTDGNTIAVGAPRNDESFTNAGHVRVFEWSGSNWSQKGSDLDGDSINWDLSGTSVDLSSDGNTVAIGAINNGVTAGQTHVYEWDGTSWVQKGANIGGEAIYDYFGRSVSLSSDGNILAVGAELNSGNGTYAGHVRVYEWDGTAWAQRGIDIDGEAAGDRSGRSVSLSADGSILAIGAELNDGNGSDAGHVRVFQWNGTVWVQKGADIDGEAALDYLGRSVSLSEDGNILAAGALNSNNAFAGSVRIYEWDGTTWMQRGVNIDGESGSDFSGSSVSLSSNGNTVAIGAVDNDGNGSDAGHVRVYKWDGTTWSQSGMDIDGEAADENSGSSVALSANGNRIIIGAPNNDENGANAGHVRVYEFDNCTTAPAVDIQTACNSFTWIDGNTYTASNNMATYTLQNSAGCDSIVTLDLTINSVNSATTTIDFTITANSQGATYQWIDCDNNNAPIAGETGQSFTATANGNYAVIVTENGCSDTSTCTSFTTIGIDELPATFGFVAFPNPTEDAVTVELDHPVAETTIIVTDIQGKVISEVYHDSLSQAEVQLGEAKGVYFVSVTSATYTSRVKIIKK